MNIDTPQPELTENFPKCCMKAIDSHSAHNHMIVCDVCNDLIKLFTDTTSYRNYLKYCNSKGRNILNGRYGEFDVIIVNKRSGKF